MMATLPATAAQSAHRLGSSCPPPDAQPQQRRPAVVVVDPISTGANLAAAIVERGVACICLHSGNVADEVAGLVDSSLHTHFAATLTFDTGHPISCIAALRQLPYELFGCVSGSELAVEVTDYVTEQLGLPGNGTALTNARRDKYLMGERIRACGLRATSQARAQTWSEVTNFAADLFSTPGASVIIKPIRSAGSDSVYLCHSLDALRGHFHAMLGATNQLGRVNDAVVVQEYLVGTEYVVDTVSRGGRHKVVAVWEYDKRRVSGADFVYFGQGNVSGHSPLGRQLVAYTLRVLDALHIVEGAGHAEVIMTPTGPCLVEVGARPQGCEGTFMPLADRCWSYNQVSALADSLVAPARFDALPDVCGDETQYAFKVDFVSRVSGRLLRLQHIDDMRALPSFVRFDMLPRMGSGWR